MSLIIFLLVRAALDDSRNAPQMTFTWLQGSSVSWLQSPVPWRYLGLDQPLPPLSHGQGVLRPCHSLALTAATQPAHHSSVHGPCSGHRRSSPTTTSKHTAWLGAPWVPRTPRPRQALRRVLSILGLNPLPAHTVPRAKRLPQPGPGHKRSHCLPGKTDTVLFVPSRLQSLSDRNKTSDRDRRLASDCCGGAAILQGEQIKTTRRPPSGPVTPLPGACPGELKHMSIQPSIHTCSQQHNSQQQKVVASPCVKWKINT